MSDNLKDAAESGFRIYGEKIQAPFSNEDLTDLLEAYKSRILASQQAAHDAEIETLHAALNAKVEICGDRQLSESNERIAHLEGLVAVKDEALKAIESEMRQKAADHSGMNSEEHYNRCYRIVMNRYKAISASAETVQAFRDKLNSEAEARGAVKALEALAFKMRDANAGELSAFMEVVDFVHIVEAEAAELRTTSKKAG